MEEHGDGMNERRALERRLAEAERARLSAVEQLRETQIELGQANARARQATLHVEQLVSGMRLLSESREVDALFSGILQVLRDVVGFEEALILSFPEERSAEVVATTT